MAIHLKFSVDCRSRRSLPRHGNLKLALMRDASLPCHLITLNYQRVAIRLRQKIEGGLFNGGPEHP